MKRWLFAIVVPIAALSVVAGGHVGQPAARLKSSKRRFPTSRMRSGGVSFTSRDLVEMYLARIERYEPLLNAVISINPRARSEAETLDAERAMGFVRGPLHGIPIAIKDNINTTSMPTTAGALSFQGYTPPYDATLVTHLQRAGAIIIAKTVLTEFANFMSFNMPANYSAVGGYGMNPYDPRPDPRAGNNDGRPALTPGGSSSGIGTAANLWVANVGTETNGSILSPAVQNMLVGIKPTVGLISRYGILPLTADQDTAGPLARTVTDAAILLGAMTGAGPARFTDRDARLRRHPGLHQLPEACGSAGRADRYPARELLQPHCWPGRRDQRRPQCGAAGRDERSDPDPEAGGGRPGRSGRHPEHRGRDTREQSAPLPQLHGESRKLLARVGRTDSSAILPLIWRPSARRRR